MILLLFLILAFILFFLCFFLLKRQTTFLVLINDLPEHRQLLKNFGFIFGTLGIVAIIVGIVDILTVSIIYLLALLVSSAIFGFLFNRKMSEKTK